VRPVVSEVVAAEWFHCHWIATHDADSAGRGGGRLGRDDKIIVFKFKRRKNYARKQGHRQGFTEVRINTVSLG
jgi:hypothetical protein